MAIGLLFLDVASLPPEMASNRNIWEEGDLRGPYFSGFLSYTTTVGKYIQSWVNLNRENKGVINVKWAINNSVRNFTEHMTGICRYMEIEMIPE